jgi:hypothetical protein
MSRSASKRSERTMRAARLAMRVRKPACSRYAAIVEKPTGYMSKTGVEGTRSLMGPHSVARRRKS